MNAKMYYEDWKARIGGPGDRSSYYTDVWEKILLPMREMAERGEAGFIPCTSDRESNVGGYFWVLLVGENHYVSLQRFVGEFSEGRLGVRPVVDSESPGLELYER